MKTTARCFAAVSICAGLALAIGCATAPTAEDSSASAVVLRIAAKALDSSTEYSITVTGPGMSRIGPRTFAGGQTIELIVPRGDARAFRFERRINQVLSDTGTTVQDIRNAVEIVAVTLVAVLRPPVIDAQPDDVFVNQGMTARFLVQASGSELAYRWYRDGAPIGGADAYDYEVSSTTLMDSGAFFYCEVSNDDGAVFSDTAWLHVVTQTVAPHIMRQPDDATVSLGGSASFSIWASGTGLRYQWYRDGSAMSGRTDTVLTIEGIVQADSGTFFYCEVSNDSGAVFSDTAWLHIATQTLPPQIVRPPADTTVSLGGSASFSVAASGTGLRYQWYRDGSAISGETDTVLTVTGVAQADSGAAFMCRVSNDSDSVDTQDAILHVSAQFTLVWNATASPGATLMGAAVTPDRIVAVGGYGHIYTSPHEFPLTWTQQTSGVSSLLTAVCWSGSLFVAVGRYDIVLTSTDAVTWTLNNTGSDAWFNGVGWNGETFMVVGNGNVLSSPDGTNWTPRTYPGQHSSDNLFNIQWIDDRWFLTGVNRIMTTVDGETWVDHSAPFKENGAHNVDGIRNFHFSNIAYSGTKYVLSYNATWAGATTFWSEDLLTWSVCEPPEHVRQAGISTMAWTGTHFVTANWSASGVSADAVTWTAYPMQSNGTSSYEKMIFTGTHLLAVGSGNTAWAVWPR